MSSVLVSFPNTGWIHKHVSRVRSRLLQDARHQVTTIDPTHNPFENNLHHIVNDFIDGDYDYWLTIDHDNPPAPNPLDLIEHDLDIVGCPTPVWHCTLNGERPWYWNAYRKHGDAYKEYQPQEGLQEVDAVGTGCILIAKRVFDSARMRRAPFQRVCNADGTVERGNDIAFCERAKSEGFRVWAHFGYPCHHFVEIDLLEMIQAHG